MRNVESFVLLAGLRMASAQPLHVVVVAGRDRTPTPRDSRNIMNHELARGK